MWQPRHNRGLVRAASSAGPAQRLVSPKQCACIMLAAPPPIRARTDALARAQASPPRRRIIFRPRRCPARGDRRGAHHPGPEAGRRAGAPGRCRRRALYRAHRALRRDPCRAARSHQRNRPRPAHRRDRLFDGRNAHRHGDGHARQPGAAPGVGRVRAPRGKIADHLAHADAHAVAAARRDDGLRAARARRAAAHDHADPRRRRAGAAVVHRQAGVGVLGRGNDARSRCGRGRQGAAARRGARQRRGDAGLQRAGGALRLRHLHRRCRADAVVAEGDPPRRPGDRGRHRTRQAPRPTGWSSSPPRS